LGCAGAAPVLGACSSYAVSDGERTVLLDCGPGTLERGARLGLLPEIAAIFISHMHADHMLDLVFFAGDLGQMELGEGRRPLLYLPRGIGPRTLERLDAALAGAERSPTRFEKAFRLMEYDAGDEITVGERLRLSFALTDHPVPCFAARATDGSAALAYGADGGPSDAVEELARGVDLLVLEATYAEDRAAAAAHGHMTAAQAGELATRAGARALLLTHLLPGAGDDLIVAARRGFDGPVTLAREGLTQELRARG
jgi:ribonuclease BN (tRNA processing enzyme)